MEDVARKQAFDAVLNAHKDLLAAGKRLSGRRLPMAGVHYDLGSAMSALRAAEAKITQAIEWIQPHVARQ